MNIISTFFESALYWNSSKETKQKIQNKRLKNLVTHARKNSPAIDRLYQNIGEDFKLSDLPITSKQMIMENYDEWVTDHRIKLKDLKEFTSDPKNIGTRFLNKYIIALTSGSTGFPFIYPITYQNLNILSVEAIFTKEFVSRPIVFVYSKQRFLVTSGTIMANMKRYPFLPLFGLHLVDSFTPIPEIVDKIEKIKPKCIFGTASTLAIIADELEKRQVKLNLDRIVCGSELLTKKVAKQLEEAFSGKALNLYGCTEGGTIAQECHCGHMHINGGWDIIEPVDENNNPVPFGQVSHKVLLTNLSSFTCPIIRYEITDKIIVHDEPCPCGNKNYWIEVEGRTASDPLVFKKGDDVVKLPPMEIYIMIETYEELKRFQLVLHENNTFECRLMFMPGVDEKAAYEKVTKTLKDYLSKYDINDVSFYRSDIEPQIDPKTLKFKSVYQV